MIKTANLATLKIREKTAKEAVSSIINQVDMVNIYLDFEPCKEWKNNPKINLHKVNNDPFRSSRKVWKALIPNQYYFVIDDDILYPQNYVEKMIETLNKYDDKVMVTVGGKLLKKGRKRGYFRDLLKNYHHSLKIDKDIKVDIAINCGAVWNTNKLNIDINKFHYFHQDDIEVSYQAQLQGIDRIMLEKEKDWLKYNEPVGKTLHEEFLRNDKTQTEIINKIEW